MSKSELIFFLKNYGWAILGAIICIGVLAYFGVFTPDKYHYSQYDIPCLAKNFCENQSLNYVIDTSDAFFRNPEAIGINCGKYISQNISWILSFRVDNLTILENKFPICNQST